MRATHTKATDYDKMLRFVRPRTGHAAPDIIQAYADKHKIVRHRAGKVFWGLVDDGCIIVDAVQGYVVTQTKNNDDEWERSER